MPGEPALAVGSFVELSRDAEDRSYIGKVISLSIEGKQQLVSAQLLLEGEEVPVQKLLLSSAWG